MAHQISHLAAHLGKRAPFTSLQQEAYLNLMRTHCAVSAPFDHLMKEHGISQPLYNILRILRGHLTRDQEAGTQHLGVPVLRIREQMVTREPDMTRLIGRLESAGHVDRTRGTEDRRVVYVHITERGLALLDTLNPLVDELHLEQFKGLAPGELRLLSTLLYRATTDSEQASRC